MDDIIHGKFGECSDATPHCSRVRVVTWNIERGRRFSAILNFLQSIEADLILLQEVDLHARRSEYRDVARELAESLRCNYVFGTQFQELGGGDHAKPAFHGLATLSPWPLANGRIIRFRRQSGFWRPLWFIPTAEVFQRRVGGRIALVVEAEIARSKAIVYNIHLESRGTDDLRVDQLRETLADAGRKSEDRHMIIGGDFNLRPRAHDAIRVLRSGGLHDAVGLPGCATVRGSTAFTGPQCIDWIYVSARIQARGLVHQFVSGSDHYPVSSTLDMEADPNQACM
jgi:endonuclease/exonuclease/phosphatase family metal-dependent hydrolase